MLHGSIVTRKTPREMLRNVAEFRERSGLDALHRFDLRDLVEHFIPRAFDVEYDYVPTHELKGRLALFDPNTMTLKIREDLSRFITLDAHRLSSAASPRPQGRAFA
jgi:hypothetical protein